MAIAEADVRRSGVAKSRQAATFSLIRLATGFHAPNIAKVAVPDRFQPVAVIRFAMFANS
jgi:hypothetical protein